MTKRKRSSGRQDGGRKGARSAWPQRALPQARRNPGAARDARAGGLRASQPRALNHDAARRARRRDRDEASAPRGDDRSINSWLKDTETRPTACRLSVLAYAPRRAGGSAPLLRRASEPPSLGGYSQIARIPPKAGQRFNDPWLRALRWLQAAYGMNVRSIARSTSQVRT